MDENNEKLKLSNKYIEEFQTNKSKEAFKDIFNLYKDDIYYFSYSYLKNEADSEEIVQETFLRVYKNLHKLTDPSKFKSWIFQIAHNLIIDRFRIKERTALVSEDYMDFLSDDLNDNPKEIFIKNETMEIIANELEQMNSIYVQTAKLRYFNEFSIKEIALAMEIPEGTVKHRLKKVRDTLKPKLERQGITTQQFKTFSFTIFNGAFSILVKRNQMSQNQSERIWEKIIASTGIIAALLHMGLGAKLLLSLGLVGLLFGGYYFVNNRDDEILSNDTLMMANSLRIIQIDYDNTSTNMPVSVAITFNREFNNDEVSLRNKIINKEMDYLIEKNVLLGEISENGVYIVKTKEEEKEFTISNINDQNPFLNGVHYKEEKLYLNFDNQDIDFSKSYYEYQGVSHSIPKDLIIEGVFEEPITFTIFDSTGNKSTYRISLNLEK